MKKIKNKKTIYLIVLIIFVVIIAVLAFFAFKPAPISEIEKPIIEEPIEPERTPEEILEDLRAPERETFLVPEEVQQEEQEMKNFLDTLRAPER